MNWIGSKSVVVALSGNRNRNRNLIRPIKFRFLFEFGHLELEPEQPVLDRFRFGFGPRSNNRFSLSFVKNYHSYTNNFLHLESPINYIKCLILTNLSIS